MLLLKHQNISHYKIAAVSDVCENTVRACFEGYQQAKHVDDKMTWLKTLNFYQPESRLKPFESIVNDYFETTPPSTISQACFDIEKLTGVCLKNTQMRAYLRSIHVTYRKVGAIPAKADIDAQKTFHDEILQPRLDEAKAGQRAVYFVDAAHFVLGAFLGCLWSFTRLFVRTPSGICWRLSKSA